MLSSDPRVLAFIDHLRESCREGKTRIILKNLKSIRDWDGVFKDGLDGYFTPPGKKSKGWIIIAANRPLPTVLHTLAHEYVHFLQWKAKIKYYNTVSYHQLEKRTEARALKLLEQFDLPIDLSARARSSSRYIKRLANSH